MKNILRYIDNSMSYNFKKIEMSNNLYDLTKNQFNNIIKYCTIKNYQYKKFTSNPFIKDCIICYYEGVEILDTKNISQIRCYTKNYEYKG